MAFCHGLCGLCQACHLTLKTTAQYIVKMDFFPSQSITTFYSYHYHPCTVQMHCSVLEETAVLCDNDIVV